MASKAEIWGQRLAACRSSGMSTAAFCREHGLAYAQYMYWQQRLGKAPGGLVPVRVVGPRDTATPLVVEVAVGSATLRVPGLTLADVVALVRGLVC